MEGTNMTILSFVIRTVVFTIAFMLMSYYLNPNLFNCCNKDIENKDTRVINEYINKHMEYLRLYFSFNVLTFNVNKECANIIKIDNKKYIKFKYAPFGLFGRSIEPDYSFENTYERIIQEHFIDMNTLLVVDEETELLLNMIK